MTVPSVFSLDLDLDVFSGPFDLLLSLVLRDDVDLAEVPVADICTTYLGRLADHAPLDLDAASEFLVLVASLLELKSRLLLPGEEADSPDTPIEAAEELAARLAEYARMQAAAHWLRAHAAQRGLRIFRSGPPALAPRAVTPPTTPADPRPLADAIARLLTPPVTVDVSHLPRRLVPVGVFLERWRRLLSERGSISFDEAVSDLDRMGVAVAFWALLELYKRGEVRLAQPAAFATIRIEPAQPARQAPASRGRHEAVA